MSKRLLVHMCDDQYKELKAYVTQLLFIVKDLDEYRMVDFMLTDLPGTVCVTLLHTHMGQLEADEIGPEELVHHYEELLSRVLVNPSEAVTTALEQLLGCIDTMVTTEYLPCDVADLADLCDFDLGDNGFKDKGMVVQNGKRVKFWRISFSSTTDLLSVEPFIEDTGYNVH